MNENQYWVDSDSWELKIDTSYLQFWLVIPGMESIFYYSDDRILWQIAYSDSFSIQLNTNQTVKCFVIMTLSSVSNSVAIFDYYCFDYSIITV